MKAAALWHFAGFALPPEHQVARSALLPVVPTEATQAASPVCPMENHLARSKCRHSSRFLHFTHSPGDRRRHHVDVRSSFITAHFDKLLFECIPLFAHFGITDLQEVDLMLTHVGRPEYVHGRIYIGCGFFIARLNVKPLCAGCFLIGSMRMLTMKHWSC